MTMKPSLKDLTTALRRCMKTPLRKGKLSCVCLDNTIRFSISGLGQNYDENEVREAFELGERMGKKLRLELVSKEIDPQQYGYRYAVLVFRKPKYIRQWQATYPFGYLGKRLGMDKAQITELRKLVERYIKKLDLECE